MSDARALLDLPLPNRPAREQLATLLRAAEAPAFWRERAEWQLANAQPTGVPLGTGVIIPSTWEPGAHLPHLVVALLTGNRVLLPATTEQHALLRAAEAGGLAVHGVSTSLANDNRLLAEPRMQFVTWWGSSHAGFTRSAELAELAPGQLAPRRVWCQLDGNGVAIIAEDTDVRRAVSGLSDFLFSALCTGSLGIERIVVAAAVYESVLEALREAASTYPPLALPAMQSAEQYYALAPYEGTVVAGGTLTVTHAAPTVVADVPPSATLACEVVRAPLVAVQQAHTQDELLSLAAGGLYGSVAAVFSNNANLARMVAERHIGHTVFLGEMRLPQPHEAMPTAKLSGMQNFPDGPELVRNYEHQIALLGE